MNIYIYIIFIIYNICTYVSLTHVWSWLPPVLSSMRAVGRSPLCCHRRQPPARCLSQTLCSSGVACLAHRSGQYRVLLPLLGAAPLLGLLPPSGP